MNLWICTKCGEHVKGTVTLVFDLANEHMCELLDSSQKSENFGKCINILKELSPETKTHTAPPPPPPPQFDLPLPIAVQAVPAAPNAASSLSRPFDSKLPAPVSMGLCSDYAYT